MTIMQYHLLETEKYVVTPHAITSQDFDALYDARLSNPNACITDLHPLLTDKKGEQTNKYPLFFVETDKMKDLAKELANNSKNLKQKFANLLDPDKRAFSHVILADEIYTTNDIEGVTLDYSDVLRMVYGQANNSYKKLHGMAVAYQDIKSGHTFKVNVLQDFRTIYDNLMGGLINDETKPNGKLFRKADGHTVLQVADAWHTVHIPPQTEKEIDQALSELLTFMHKSTLAPIYKALITHFFFENTHPFNDGNGRTGRFLFSNYVAKHYDFLTACSFADSLANWLNMYYKAFKDTDKAENRAEVTLFIMKLMQLIIMKQNDLLEDMDNILA